MEKWSHFSPLVGKGQGLGKWRSLALLPRPGAGTAPTLPSIEAAVLIKTGVEAGDGQGKAGERMVGHFSALGLTAERG